MDQGHKEQKTHGLHEKAQPLHGTDLRVAYEDTIPARRERRSDLVNDFGGTLSGMPGVRRSSWTASTARCRFMGAPTAT